MNQEQLLIRFGRGLLAVREVFHKTGRLDDSNAKLDEIVKLIALELAQVKHQESGITPLADILAKSREHENFPIVRELNDNLKRASRLPLFMNEDGESLFGPVPAFLLNNSDKRLAEDLIELVLETLNNSLREQGTPETFDLLNEAFGHFVRDNFRNNIEDAQYMTPPEVVIYMCRIGLQEIRKRKDLSGKPLVVVDPSCGVGSFLAQFYRLLIHTEGRCGREIMLIGQDKVDRMARLSRINLLLFDIKNAHIYRGNSLVGESPLSRFENQCDLILTNPPFGARFQSLELRPSPESKYPLLHDLIQRTEAVFDSELLFIDRYVSLLKPGGIALAIVPDGVVSAKGTPEFLRTRLSSQCTLRSVTELPAVTFAQAGTRTRTCVLHFRKNPPKKSVCVFMANAKSIGFEVSSRKGVPVKRLEGTNDLLRIYEGFEKFYGIRNCAQHQIVITDPSCVAVSIDEILSNSWTPNYHSSSRYLAVDQLKRLHNSQEIELKELHELVTFPNTVRKRWPVSQETKCISVLHVGNFGYLDIEEIMKYRPKYPGQPCMPGDLLFSKINPRIPRVVVVPDLGVKLACSDEFEVMRAREPLSSYALMLLLLSPFVQTQVRSLTTGTSSSHNRIKREQLGKILLPLPKGGTSGRKEFNRLSKSFEEAAVSVNEAARKLHLSMKELKKLFPIGI